MACSVNWVNVNAGGSDSDKVGVPEKEPISPGSKVNLTFGKKMWLSNVIQDQHPKRQSACMGKSGALFCIHL